MKNPNDNWPKKAFDWVENGVRFFSIPFTWELPKVWAEIMQRPLFGEYFNVVVGGPAMKLIPNFFDDLDFVLVGDSMPGILQRINPLATKTTRGCFRKCDFCLVDEIEGTFHELPDWPDLPILIDDNLLKSSIGHFDRVVDRLVCWGWADFNQGLDVRLLTDYHAKRLAEIKNPIIRLALDSMDYSEKWLAAIETLNRAGIPKYKIKTFCLVGFNSDPAECWERCEFVVKNGIKPFPAWFHKKKALKVGGITKEQKKLGWNDYERRKILQWYYQHKKAKKY